MILYRWQSIPVTAVSHTCIPWGNDKYCFNLLASKDIFVYHVFLNVFFCLFNPVEFILVAFTFHARIAGSSALPATPWITWSSVSFCSKRSRNCRCSVGLGTSGLGDISANAFFLQIFWNMYLKYIYCMIGIFLGFFKLISNLFEKNAKAEAMPPQRSEWGRLEMHSSAHHIRRWNECP